MTPALAIAELKLCRSEWKERFDIARPPSTERVVFPSTPGLVHNGCEATAQAVFAAASLSGNARCASSSPAQILLYYPSVKKQRPRQRRNVVQEVSDACPSWRDSGHSKGYLHFSRFPTETAERSPRKNAETSPIRRSRACPQSLFRCRSFSERPIEKPEKAGWEIHPVMKLTVL